MALLGASFSTRALCPLDMCLLPSRAMRGLVRRRRGKAAPLPLQKRRWQARRARTSTTTIGVALSELGFSISGNSLPPTPPQGAGRSRQGGGGLFLGGVSAGLGPQVALGSAAWWPPVLPGGTRSSRFLVQGEFRDSRGFFNAGFGFPAALSCLKHSYFVVTGSTGGVCAI